MLLGLQYSLCPNIGNGVSRLSHSLIAEKMQLIPQTGIRCYWDVKKEKAVCDGSVRKDFLAEMGVKC
jgi:hypothetical protein